MSSGPVDEVDAVPPLSDQIEPYRPYGDAELALALLHYAKANQSLVTLRQPGKAPEPQFPAPATAGANLHCPNCDEDVRTVTIPRRGTLDIMRCPLCGETPGMLELGRQRPYEVSDGE